MRPVSVLLLVSLSAAVVVINAYSVPKPENNCSDNQHWDECGSRCPERCYNGRHIGTPCLKGCARGCFCNKGYMKESETSSHCVKPEDCPKINPVPPPKPPAPCPKNMTRELDCIPCTQYCDKKKNKMCPRICKPPTECYCKPGYVYDNMNNCVLPQDCPKK
ncbi:hypothetical protein GDO78_021382 [Eleutherodactylus coqui]|uniref:TIL domain-containing protein n=1 Tax=Eleutherodactylus coqui TaxID=57060 RepID=A0A8J6BHF3_ELECQ|nr:hypothetical protein GDO78_021382 [Eleutherodactylus coqui]